MKGSKLSLTVAAMGMLVLITDSRTAVQAASSGMDLCIRTVIPSLFPFFILSGYLTGNLRGGSWLARLFRCPESCGTILLTGLLAGYPIGARLAAQGYRSGSISKAQGDRLLMFCSQAGPSFLFGITAAQMGSLSTAWLLWAVQILSALSVAWIIPLPDDKGTVSSQSQRITLTEAMNSAIKAMSFVCGWVIVFSVVTVFLKRWFLWILPESIQILLCGILELTNGCLMLSSAINYKIRFLLATVMLNCGGLCILMQTSSVAAGLSLRRYLEGKILQTSFALLYAGTFLGNYYCLIPVFCVISSRLFAMIRKNSRFPTGIGV